MKGVLNTFVLLVVLAGTGFGQSKAALEAYNKALPLYSSSNFALAIPLLKNAMAADTTFSVAERCLAVCYEETGSPQLAIGCYERILRRGVADEKIWYSLAALYHKDGQKDKARAAAQKSLAINSGYLKAQKLLSIIDKPEVKKEAKVKKEKKEERDTVSLSDIYLKEYNKALDEYKSAEFYRCRRTLQAIPNEYLEADGAYLTGIVCLKLKDTMSAKFAFQETLRKQYNYAEASLSLGLIEYNNGRYQGAADFFLQATKSTPTNPYAGYFLGRTYLAQKKPDIAITYLEEAVLYIPNVDESKKYLKEAYDMLNKNVETSFALKEKARDKLTPAALALQKKGVEAYNNKDCKTAIDYFEQAVKLGPNLAKLHYYLGMALMECGKVTKGRLEFEKTVELDENYSKAYVSLGRTFYEEAEYEKAGRYYSTAIELGDEEPNVYFDLANSFFKVNNYPKAIMYYEKAIRLKATVPEYYLNLAISQQLVKNFNGSIETLNTLIKLKPNYPDAFYYLAIGNLESGEYEKALEVAKQCTTNFPKFAPGYIALANVYEKMGNTDLSLTNREKAYKLDPSLKD